jgi:hypothetical protein
MPSQHSSLLNTLHMVEGYESRRIHISLGTSVLTGDEGTHKRHFQNALLMNWF